MHNGERNERSVTYLGTNMASKFEKFAIYIYIFLLLFYFISFAIHVKKQKQDLK